MKSLFLLQKEDFDHIGVMNLMMSTLVKRKLKISAENQITSKILTVLIDQKMVLGDQ